MSDRSFQVASAHGTLAALKRHHPNSPELIAPAARELKVAILAEYIRKVVDAAPPLTADQRDRLAVLLRGGPDAA